MSVKINLMVSLDIDDNSWEELRGLIREETDFKDKLEIDKKIVDVFEEMGKEEIEEIYDLKELNGSVKFDLHSYDLGYCKKNIPIDNVN